MSHMLILAAVNQNTFFGANAESVILIDWLQDNLVDLLELHLGEDLSALRKIAPPSVTKRELIAEGYTPEAVRTTIEHVNVARKAALQPPEHIIQAIDRILRHIGDDGTAFPPGLLHMLATDTKALLWNGEEVYFSNGQFAEDMQWLKDAAQKAASLHIKHVRILVERW